MGGGNTAKTLSLIRSLFAPLSRDNAGPVQPGRRTDYSSLCFSWCHGGSGVLCGADQQSEEQAKETETTSETTAAYAAGSSTKDAFCLKALACQRGFPFTGCFPGRSVDCSRGRCSKRSTDPTGDLLLTSSHSLWFLEREKKQGPQLVICR